MGAERTIFLLCPGGKGGGPEWRVVCSVRGWVTSVSPSASEQHCLLPKESEVAYLRDPAPLVPHPRVCFPSLAFPEQNGMGHRGPDLTGPPRAPFPASRHR